MKSLRDLTDLIYSGGDRDKKEDANAIYYEAADYVKANSPGMYEKLVKKAEDILYEFDTAWAQEKVRRMEPAGEHWSYDQVKEIARAHGIESGFKAYYLVMNMYYNDSRRTVEKYQVDTPDFYFDLAHDFIRDPDAPDHKVAKYFSLA